MRPCRENVTAIAPKSPESIAQGTAQMFSHSPKIDFAFFNARIKETSEEIRRT